MIGTIAKAVLGGAINNAIDKAAGAFEAYQNKQISQEEYDARRRQAGIEAMADIEGRWAEVAGEMFETFQQSMRWHRSLRIAYVVSLFASIWVLFWYAWIQPCGVAWQDGSFPACKTGDLILTWHYWLLAGQLGLGPLIMGGGGKAGGAIERLASRFKR